MGSFFSKKDENRKIDEKKSYLIGIVGDEYKDYIQKTFPKSEIIVYEDYKTIFQDFTKKKIELIYDDKIAVEFYALRHNMFDSIKSIEVLNSTPNIKAISKDQRLVDIFNRGLKNITPI